MASINLTMRAVVILVFAFAVLQIEANPLRLKRGVREPEAENCVTELNLNRERTFEIASRDYKPEDDADFIKFMKCYWKKKGYLYQDGDINYDALRQMISDTFQNGFSSDCSSINLADTVLSKCENISATTVGQGAIKLGNCIMKNLRELLIYK